MTSTFSRLLIFRPPTNERPAIHIPSSKNLYSENVSSFSDSRWRLLTKTCVLSIYCNVASSIFNQIKYYFFENNNTFFVNLDLINFLTVYYEDELTFHSFSKKSIKTNLFTDNPIPSILVSIPRMNAIHSYIQM